MKRLIFTFFFLLMAIISFSQQMEFEITGSITFNNSNYSISEAGEDYQASIENESSVYISVVNNDYWDKYFNPNKKWSVSISKSDIAWDADLILQVKRAGNGDGSGHGHSSNSHNSQIYDGTYYQTVSDMPIYFFSGKREVYDIPLTFKVSGASVTMGAQQFETNIILTISDDW